MVGTPYIEGLDNDFAFSLLYNSVMRAGIPPQRPPHVPFDRTVDELEFGGKYIESSGWAVTMTKLYGHNTVEYRDGFRFVGDNGVSYRQDGTTMVPTSRYLNDVVARIIEEAVKYD